MTRVSLHAKLRKGMTMTPFQFARKRKQGKKTKRTILRTRIFLTDSIVMQHPPLLRNTTLLDGRPNKRFTVVTNERRCARDR